MNTYRFYISNELMIRLEELLETFNDIKPRIITQAKGRYLSRIEIELSNEEIAVLKLGLNPDEYVVALGPFPDPTTAIFEKFVESR